MKKIIVSLIAVALVLLLLGCASSGLTILKSYEAQPEQLKRFDIDIKITPLSPKNMYDHPGLFRYSKMMIPVLFGNGDSYYPDGTHNQNWCYTFGDEDKTLLAFYVSITNNTSHELNIHDAEITLVKEGSEPVKAIRSVGDYSVQPVSEETVWPVSYINKDQSLVHYISYWEDRSLKSESELAFPYPVGYASMVLQQNRSDYQLINNKNTNILPDHTSTGLLVFGKLFDPQNLSDMTIVIDHLISDTDPSGKPVDNVKFEIPITYEPIDMFFDTKVKMWKEESQVVAE